MDFSITDNKLCIVTCEKIFSDNLNDVENEINKIISENSHDELTLDCSKLEYISSAGLRLVLKLAKNENDFKIINVSKDVYDIFEMTGFSEMLNIKKAYRNISLEGAEVVGQGFFSEVYRIDKDTICKVFIRDDDFKNVERELSLAKQGFILGLPTAISYDAALANGKPALVFEMLDCDSLRDALKKYPERFDEYMKKYAELLKTINTTDVGNTSLPDAKEVAKEKLELVKDSLDAEIYDKMKTMLSDVKEETTFIHGDCQIKNIMINNGDFLLIDMDTLSVGNPIFELASLYAAYNSFKTYNPKQAEFFGLCDEILDKIFDNIFNYYFDNVSDDDKKENLNKIKVVCDLHMMYWIRSNAKDRADCFEIFKNELEEDIKLINDLNIVR